MAFSHGEFWTRIRGNGSAVVRGIKLSDDDKVCSFVIENLMCRFDFSASELKRRFGAATLPLIAEAVFDADCKGLSSLRLTASA